MNLLEGSDGNNDSISTYLINKGKGTATIFSVDGKKKSVQEKEAFPTGESGLCNCQSYDGHTIISNYNKGTFGEYDKEGKVTKQFSTGKRVDGIVKCSLNGLCFYAG